MKLFQSLWVLTDNDAMDVTQIEPPVPVEGSQEAEAAFTPYIQPKYDYSNIINLLDYIKVKNTAYQG